MSAVPDYDRSATLTHTDDLRERVAPGGGVSTRADWPTAPWEFERRYQVLRLAEYEALRAWVEANEHLAVTTEDPDGATVQCAIREFRAEALAAGLWRCTLVLWGLVPAQVETVPSIAVTSTERLTKYEIVNETTPHVYDSPAATCTLEHVKEHATNPGNILSAALNTSTNRCEYVRSGLYGNTTESFQIFAQLYCPAGTTETVDPSTNTTICKPDQPYICPAADPPYTLSADGLTCSRPLL